MKKILIGASVFFLTLSLSTAPLWAGTYAEDKQQAELYAESLIKARKEKAVILSASGSMITEKDFIKTYGKVYGQIAELKKKEGYIITFSAIKARNPQNAATPFEARLMASFKSDRAFKKFWTVTMVQGRSYSRLVKPVFAEKACLVCHGARDKRPAFIPKRYPGDKSFAFKEGDLMGLISVYMPDEEDE